MPPVRLYSHVTPRPTSCRPDHAALHGRHCCSVRGTRHIPRGGVLSQILSPDTWEVLENNNGFLTQLWAEGRPLCRSLPESLSASVLVSCQEVGPGEPESAAVQSVRPSAW